MSWGFFLCAKTYLIFYPHCAWMFFFVNKSACLCIACFIMYVCGCLCRCTYVARWSKCVPGDPGVIRLVTTRTMWHLQISAVPLPTELAQSQLELCHLDWPKLKWPVWDWSRVRGSSRHSRNIHLNTNLLSFRWKKSNNKEQRNKFCGIHLRV